MMRDRFVSCSMVLCAVLSAPAVAADRPVHLTVPPALAKDLSAMPPIAGPVDAAETGINAALRRLDAKVVKAAAECRTDGGKNSSWERTVDAAMRGPRFLSYAVTDNTYCGGAHPNVSTWSIVYDLASGAPVDWTTLLPASLTGTVALAEQAEGSKIVTLASKRLHALYLERYRPDTRGSKNDADKDCREAVAETFDGNPPAMMVWLDAKEDGLALQFDLAHVVQACADRVLIPTSVLRSEGASATLIDAVDAAHAMRKVP